MKRISPTKRNTMAVSQFKTIHHPQARTPARPAVTKIADVYCVFRWKDELDASAPLWKRLFFRLIYRPFNQFCRFRLKIPSYNGESQDGRLWYLDVLGGVSEKWQAEQCAKDRNYGYMGLSVDSLLPPETTTCCTDLNYPLTDAPTQERYVRNGKPTMDVPRLDMVRLAAKIEATRPLVENYGLKA